MTSERAGDQVSQESVDSTLVKATSALGGHDRLNEAPQERPVCCGRYMYLAFTALDAFYCGTCGYMPVHPLRDGQPGKR